MGRVSLKGIKYAAFASEETSCFEATVYIDGVKAGTVSNSGKGGCDMFYPWELQDKLTAIAKEELPPKSLGEGLGNWDPDAERLVGELFDEWLLSRDLTRALKSKVLFTKEDGKLYEMRPRKGTTVAQVLSRITVPPGWKAILNLMPFDQALALYKEAGA